MGDARQVQRCAVLVGSGFIFSPPPHNVGGGSTRVAQWLYSSPSVLSQEIGVLGFDLLTGFMSVLVGGWLCPHCLARGRRRAGAGEGTQMESLGGRIQGFRHNIREKRNMKREGFSSGREEILLGAENRGRGGGRDGHTQGTQR